MSSKIRNTSPHVVRRFSVSKMIAASDRMDIALIKVNGEIDIRYFFQF